MRSLTLLFGVAIVFVAVTALANIAAVHENPSALTAPRYATSTTLRVGDEILTFDCDEWADGSVACSFEARYHIENLEPATEKVVAAFYGIQTSAVAITIDGRAETHALTPEEVEALDRAVIRRQGVDPAPTDEELDKITKDPTLFEAKLALDRWDDRPIQRYGFVLEAAPGSKHEIVARGRIEGGLRFVPHGYSPSPTRHPWLGATSYDRHFDFTYLLSPIRTWGGDPQMKVTIRAPSSWEISGSNGVFESGTEGGRATATTTISKGGARTLDFALTLPAGALHNGGAFVGVGGALGDSTGGRARVGYQISAPDWLFYGAAFDTDFKHHAVVAPMIEAASPMLFFLPSFGAGLGAPIMLSPLKRVGMRLLLDLFIGPVGFATTIDFYPTTSTNDAQTSTTLMVEFGF